MIALRRLVVPFAGASVFAGCLFPSFDDLPKADGGASSGASSSSSGDVDPTQDGGNSSGSPPDAKSSSSGAVDAGPDAVVRGEKDLRCGEDKACPVPANFCCTTIGGLSCQGPGTEGFCTTVEGGEILRCDGAEDCNAGQVCCAVTGSGASCQTSCTSGKELCNGPLAKCPAGKSCNATIKGGIKACSP